jgi:hypothetical protein
LRCCSANCSSADCDGSFKVKKPSIALGFFFFGALPSFDEEALEARLGDVRLGVSNEGRTGDEVEVVLGVKSRRSVRASLDWVSEPEVF